MRGFTILFFLTMIIYTSHGQTGDPYYLGLNNYPRLKLPPTLRVEGINGKIITHLKMDTHANIVNIEWGVLLLKDGGGNWFIQYRDAINKGYKWKDYPLPIRPYVDLIDEKIKELEFKRDKRIPIPAGDWYFTIPYQVF